MGQQLLAVPPQNLLPHLGLELNLYRLKIPHPALRCYKRIIRAKEKAILQASGGLAQQRIGYVTGRPARPTFNILVFNTFTISRFPGAIAHGTALPSGLMACSLLFSRFFKNECQTANAVKRTSAAFTRVVSSRSPAYVSPPIAFPSSKPPAVSS